MVYRPYYLDVKAKTTDYYADGELYLSLKEGETRAFKRKEVEEVEKFYGRKKKRGPKKRY